MFIDAAFTGGTDIGARRSIFPSVVAESSRRTSEWFQYDDSSWWDWDRTDPPEYWRMGSVEDPPQLYFRSLRREDNPEPSAADDAPLKFYCTRDGAFGPILDHHLQHPILYRDDLLEELARYEIRGFETRRAIIEYTHREDVFTNYSAILPELEFEIGADEVTTPDLGPSTVSLVWWGRRLVISSPMRRELEPRFWGTIRFDPPDLRPPFLG